MKIKLFHSFYITFAYKCANAKEDWEVNYECLWLVLNILEYYSKILKSHL